MYALSYRFPQKNNSRVCRMHAHGALAKDFCIRLHSLVSWCQRNRLGWASAHADATSETRARIVGLIRLAEKNLAIAEETRVEGGRYYRAAVDFAFTGVENISRALIHCYGGKPDPWLGQEEALKLLSTRFQGDEKAEFEKAIDGIAFIVHNKIVLGYTLRHNIQIRPLDEA